MSLGLCFTLCVCVWDNALCNVLCELSQVDHYILQVFVWSSEVACIHKNGYVWICLLGWRDGSIGRPLDLRSKGLKVRIPSGAQEKCVCFQGQNCCTDSLSVCPTPVCICMHKNDHESALKDHVVHIWVWWITERPNMHRKIISELALHTMWL